jgi:hypothetical protein
VLPAGARKLALAIAPLAPHSTPCSRVGSSGSLCRTAWGPYPRGLLPHSGPPVDRGTDVVDPVHIPPSPGVTLPTQSLHVRLHHRHAPFPVISVPKSVLKYCIRYGIALLKYCPPRTATALTVRPGVAPSPSRQKCTNHASRVPSVVLPRVRVQSQLAHGPSASVACSHGGQLGDASK